ncbi:hypothetical protein JOM56_013294 [Amanita muscaria]
MTYQGKAVKIWDDNNSLWRDCFDAFIWGSLSHASIVPCLGICFQSRIVARISPSLENRNLNKWRRSSNPSVSKIQQTFFEVAKAIQYVHSLGIAISYRFDEVVLHLR